MKEKTRREIETSSDHDSNAQQLAATENKAMVFGDGSAAIFLINQLVEQGRSVIWSMGSGARLSPVMPFVKSESALAVLSHAREGGISNELHAKAEDSPAKSAAQKAATNLLNLPLEKGLFHRVFRNKAFKLGSWKRGSNLEAQEAAFEDSVWKPEQAFIGVTEYKIAGLSAAAIEQNLRTALEGHPLIRKIASAPITEVEVYQQGGTIQFANGEIAQFSEFYYCDSIGELKAVPKLATVFKHQLGNVKMGSRMSALQVTFQHSKALKQKIQNGLVIPMNRDSGETFDRDLMGHFISDTESVWTVLMQATETEENHEIMKKLRKLKQTLNRAFDNPEFLPDGAKEFMSTVEKELVRFEEAYLISEGEFKSSAPNSDFVLLTDSFGLTYALEKIATRFGIEAAGPEAYLVHSLEVEADAVGEAMNHLNDSAETESDFPMNLDRSDLEGHSEPLSHS